MCNIIIYYNNYIGILAFECPRDVTGFVIGKNGKNLREVESKTNTVLKVEKNEHDLAENAKVLIIGKKEDCVKALKLIIQKINLKRALHTATTVTIEIPNQHCGRVIGKKGANVRAIQDLTGTRIQVESLKGFEAFMPDAMAKCEITGTPDQIEKAKEMIQKSVEGSDIAGAAYITAFMLRFMKELKDEGFGSSS